MTTRASAVRVVASSLCFDQDPPPIRSLASARVAAAAIVDALRDAGMIDTEPAPEVPANDNGTTPIKRGPGRPPKSAAAVQAPVDPAQTEFPVSN